MATPIIKTYSELVTLPTFNERYRYVRLGGKVGEETFGFERYLNQSFYKSEEWKSIRAEVIIRDNGCDLGVAGRDIGNRIIIHHMNPITKMDIISRTEFLLNPEYLICTCKSTHDAIHYGNETLIFNDSVARTKYDTCPWRKLRKEAIL
jgi:hypothetical protein